MKGIIILTADERAYREGSFIETRGIQYPPTGDKTTYIVHVDSITEKEIKRWMDIVSYRMVFVVEKSPTLSSQIKDEIIIDKSLKVGDAGFKKEIDALLRWSDRNRVHQMFIGTPIPLALAFLRENRIKEIELWRTLAKVKFTLPTEYAEAVLCYGVTPSREQVKWPKKKAKVGERPSMFRESDKYWREIVEADGKVRNTIRKQNVEELPPDVKKRQERISEWI